jgi:hypothetical protein
MKPYTIDPNRGTGRTTRQLEAMPLNGVFICPNRASMYYTQNLTRKINRSDIQLVAPNWVTSMRWQGMRYTAIVLDHAYPELNRNNRFSTTT